MRARRENDQLASTMEELGKRRQGTTTWFLLPLYPVAGEAAVGQRSCLAKGAILSVANREAMLCEPCLPWRPRRVWLIPVSIIGGHARRASHTAWRRMTDQNLTSRLQSSTSS